MHACMLARFNITSLRAATFACQMPASFFSGYNYWFCNAALRLQREEKHWGTLFCSLRPPAFVYWSLRINHCQVILKSQNNETVTEWAQIAASIWNEVTLKWARRQSSSVQCLCAVDVHMHAFVHATCLSSLCLFNFSACARVCWLRVHASSFISFLDSCILSRSHGPNYQ